LVGGVFRAKRIDHHPCRRAFHDRPWEASRASTIGGTGRRVGSSISSGNVKKCTALNVGCNSVGLDDKLQAFKALDVCPAPEEGPCLMLRPPPLIMEQGILDGSVTRVVIP
jgi:hypothetical protein